VLVRRTSDSSVKSAYISADAALLGVVATAAVAIFAFWYARLTNKDQGEQLDRTLKAQREQLDETLAEQRIRTLNERFATAAGQLGSDKPAAVRLAGVYAMAGLADDWPENRQTCVDVLCAYLRLPYETERSSDEAPESIRLGFRAGREVRHTVIRVISAHLKDSGAMSWQGLNFDFTGAVFDGGDFSGAKFTGGTVTFRDAEFTSGEVTFRDAEFTGGEISFYGATFSDGEVSFERAKFAGSKVNFFWAVFHNCWVGFDRAEFSGPMVGFDYARFLNRRRVITFDGAVFSDGVVSFGTATFDGGLVYFKGAKFDGSRFDFRALFSDGTVSFERAEFTSSTVSFDYATLNGGLVRFDGAVFSGGLVRFGTIDVTATGPPGILNGSRISFDGAEFTGGTVTWNIPVLSGEVDFSKARVRSSPPTFWGVPLMELAAPGHTPPAWVKLPEKEDQSQA
jgi:uncharacterized protein YjbI with pentapeptide repeats